MNIKDLWSKETCVCPRCKTPTHPEYLTYETYSGEVVACSACKSTLKWKVDHYG